MSTKEIVKKTVSYFDQGYKNGTNYTLNLLEIRMKARGQMTYSDFLEWRELSFPDYKPIIDISKVEL